MATQKPTTLGYAEIATLVSDVTTAMAAGASGAESVQGLTGACTAAEGSTFANPGGATKIAANGFDVQNATVTTSDSGAGVNDTVEVDHIFTCDTAPQSVTGFTVMNDDDDVVFMEACFAAAVPCEINDTITIEAKMQFKLGA